MSRGNGASGLDGFFKPRKCFQMVVYVFLNLLVVHVVGDVREPGVFCPDSFGIAQRLKEIAVA